MARRFGGAPGGEAADDPNQKIEHPVAAGQTVHPAITHDRRDGIHGVHGELLHVPPRQISTAPNTSRQTYLLLLSQLASPPSWPGPKTTYLVRPVQAFNDSDLHDVEVTHTTCAHPPRPIPACHVGGRWRWALTRWAGGFVGDGRRGPQVGGAQELGVGVGGVSQRGVGGVGGQCPKVGDDLAGKYA